MTPLEQAQVRLSDQILSLKRPAEGSADWFLLHSLGIALSYLRNLKVLSATEPQNASRIYKETLTRNKRLELPAEELLASAELAASPETLDGK